VKLNYSKLAWDTSSWQTFLNNLARNLFNEPSLIVLVSGGVHLKALALLVNGTEELRSSTLEKTIVSSVSSLLSMGVPYQLIRDTMDNPTASNLLKLFAYASKNSSAETCLRNLTLKMISFVMHVERGNTGRARAIAEDVLNSMSLFFGSIMVSIVEKSPVGYVVRAPSSGDISEEVLEKLISVIRGSSINIGEALATYSIEDLIDLYEKLTSDVRVDIAPQVSSNTTSITTLLNQGFEEMEVDEDVLRYSLITNVSREGSPKDVSKSSEGAKVFDDQEVTEIVSKLTHRVMATVLNTIEKTTFKEYLIKSVQRRQSTLTHTPVNQDKESSWELVLASLVIAASLGGFSQLVFRKRYFELSLSKKALNLGREARLIDNLNPVVKFFWDVVSQLLATRDVELSPSDTHREIVEKLSSNVDDVTSAALRRLGKLYEVARYSKSPSVELLMEDLEFLKSFLGK